MADGNATALRDTHGVTGGGWYGFDLDGTLARYDGWKGIDHIGEPVKPMVELIKRMHNEGKVVKIMTARVSPRPHPEMAKTRYPLYAGAGIGDVPEYAARWMSEMRKAGHVNDQVEACSFYFKEEWTAHDFITDWCLENLGFLPEIVYQKDHLMIELYDDRVKQVVPNTGILVENLAGAGNVTALREALCDIVMLTMKVGLSIRGDVACGIIANKAKRALAAPARNCDRYHTVEEAFAACHEDRGYLSDPVAERRSTISFMLSDAQEMAKFEQCDSAFPDGSCAPVEGRKGETDGSK